MEVQDFLEGSIHPISKGKSLENRSWKCRMIWKMLSIPSPRVYHYNIKDGSAGLFGTSYPSHLQG